MRIWRRRMLRLSIPHRTRSGPASLRASISQQLEQRPRESSKVVRAVEDAFNVEVLASLHWLSTNYSRRIRGSREVCARHRMTDRITVSNDALECSSG